MPGELYHPGRSQEGKHAGAYSELGRGQSCWKLSGRCMPKGRVRNVQYGSELRAYDLSQSLTPPILGSFHHEGRTLLPAPSPPCIRHFGLGARTALCGAFGNKVYPNHQNVPGSVFRTFVLNIQLEMFNQQSDSPISISVQLITINCFNQTRCEIIKMN